MNGDMARRDLDAIAAAQREGYDMAQRFYARERRRHMLKATLIGLVSFAAVVLGAYAVAALVLHDAFKALR